MNTYFTPQCIIVNIECKTRISELVDTYLICDYNTSV